ncbi:hypothetical protein Tco_1067791 [Tanacetum coccineum]|uniref:Uncharacterized protein n=1 Tax=Tanacetum coccineum TaxID=301880 RepID=A0ABQ5HES2_9ASTR
MMQTDRGDDVASIKRRRRDLYSYGVEDLTMALGRNRLNSDLEYLTCGEVSIGFPLFKLDTQEITYIMDMFHDTLHLLVETLDNPFFAPVTIEIIKSFMQRVGYQGVVDKVSAFYTKFLAHPWQTMFKKFPSIPPRLEEDYHSIKDDILLVSVYTTWNVTVRGMLIPDAFLTEEIRVTDDYKEYEMVFVNIVVPINQPQLGKKRKQSAGKTSSLQKSLNVTIKQKQVVEGEKDEESYADKFAASMLHDDVDDSRDKIKPESHKEHPEVVDDDENKEEKKNEKKDDVMGSLENRNEKMQTPIPTTPRSPRINLSSDKNIAQELTDTVSLSTATTSKDPHKKKCISSKYSHLSGALRRMCRRQGYMIRDMERKCVTTDEFWKVHGKVDQVLYEIVPQLLERATNDLTKGNLKRVVADTVIQERDAFHSEVHDLISNEFDAQAHQIIEELFKNYVQNNIIQVHPTTTTSIDTTSSTDHQQQLYLKMKEDDFHSQRHDDHQEDYAPPKGGKRVKRHKTSKSSKYAREETIIDEDEVRPEDETPELITEFQNVNKRVPTFFDHARMEATLNEMLSNQFRNAEE